MTEENKNEKEELVDWQAKADEYLDGWKRAKADYINREKTISQEKSAIREIMEEMMILEFLPVLDNLKSALTTIGSLAPYSNEDEVVIKTIGSLASYSKGIEHVVKQFENTLNNFGVQAMDLIGKEYDASFAEAAEKEGEGNKVIKIVLDGYKKGERVIRPARVIIG